MNRSHLLLGTCLLANCVLSAPSYAALVDTTPPAAGATSSVDSVAEWLASTADDNGRAFALASGPQLVTAEQGSTAAAVGSGTVPGATTLSLWTFITTMRAQQHGDRFVALESSASLLRLAEDPVAPVPLPGALWLLVMGLLGMAGVRFTGPGKSAVAVQALPAPSAASPRLGLALAQA